MTGLALKCKHLATKFEKFANSQVSAKDLKREQLNQMKAARMRKLYDLIMADIETFTDESSVEREVLVQRLVSYIEKRVDIGMIAPKKVSTTSNMTHRHPFSAEEIIEEAPTRDCK